MAFSLPDGGKYVMNFSSPSRNVTKEQVEAAMNYIVDNQVLLVGGVSPDKWLEAYVNTVDETDI